MRAAEVASLLRHVKLLHHCLWFTKFETLYLYIYFFSLWAGYKKKMSGLVRSNCSVISMQARPGIVAPPSNEAASFYESVMPVMVHLVSLVESICKLSKAFRKILRPHICLNEFGTSWAHCCSSFFSCHFEMVTLFFTALVLFEPALGHLWARRKQLLASKASFCYFGC